MLWPVLLSLLLAAVEVSEAGGNLKCWQCAVKKGALGRPIL